MWRSRNNRDETTVVCIACGTSLPRSEAREYDKLGNRWERHGKSFEHLCKECYRELCHQPRDELEALLVDVERTIDTDGDTEVGVDSAADHDADTADHDADPTTGRGSDPTTHRESEPNLPIEPDAAREDGERDDDTDRTFLAEYFRTVEDRYGTAEEPGHES
jgi:hypothetical protein